MTDKGKILGEIHAYYASRKQGNEMQEGDLTYDDIKQDMHLGHSAAQRLMTEMVNDGLFERVENVLVNGTRRVVFRKVTPR